MPHVNPHGHDRASLGWLDRERQACGRRRLRDRIESRPTGAGFGHDRSATRGAVARVAGEQESLIGLRLQFDSLAVRSRDCAVRSYGAAADASAQDRSARRLGDRQLMAGRPDRASGR